MRAAVEDDAFYHRLFLHAYGRAFTEESLHAHFPRRVPASSSSPPALLLLSCGADHVEAVAVDAAAG